MWHVLAKAQSSLSPVSEVREALGFVLVFEMGGKSNNIFGQTLRKLQNYLFFMSEHASLGPNLNSGSRMPLNGKSRSHPQYRLFTIHRQNFIFPFLPAHSTLNTQDVTGFSGRVDSSLRRQPSSFFVARLEVNTLRTGSFKLFKRQSRGI